MAVSLSPLFGIRPRKKRGLRHITGLATEEQETGIGVFWGADLRRIILTDPTSSYSLSEGAMPPRIASSIPHSPPVDAESHHGRYCGLGPHLRVPSHPIVSDVGGLSGR